MNRFFFLVLTFTFLTAPKSIFAIQKQTDFLTNPITHKKILLGNHKTKISKFEIIKNDPNLIANMQSEFKNSSGRSWENAQFERKTKNSYSRTYLSEDGTYYTLYSQGGSWYKGSGILGKVTSHTHNTCYFGTTAACLSNIVTTYYELYIEENKLVEYYKTGRNGEPNITIIGTLRPGFSVSSNINHTFFILFGVFILISILLINKTKLLDTKFLEKIFKDII